MEHSSASAAASSRPSTNPAPPSVRGTRSPRVHPVENGFGPAETLRAPRDGIIVFQRTSAHVHHGDIVLDVATEIDREELLRG